MDILARTLLSHAPIQGGLPQYRRCGYNAASSAPSEQNSQEFFDAMAIERTLSIIKPDATRRNLTGKINAKFEERGLRIVAQKRLRLSTPMAEQFYAVHAERPFFRDLVTFMVSGPVVAQVLEGENAVAANRDIMGATNPANAAPGTIRKEFAESIEANSVHGSDSLDNARREIAFFFAETEICP
jgi:nucleoside-diphosphate kinase